MFYYLKIFKSNRLNDYLRQLNGQEVELTVSKKGRRRSNQQNRWYWGIVIKLISDETGQSPETIHEFLKQECGGREEMKFLKKGDKEPIIIKVQVSTKKLLTTQFSEYTKRIQQWATEFLGMNIPDPDTAKIKEN